MSMGAMRQLAAESLGKAEKLSTRMNAEYVKYTCLELRFCIEYLCYAQLYSYLEELPYDAAKKWTPKQVISEMLSVDPHADESSQISIGLESTPGQESDQMQFLGNNNVFKLKWANKTHNLLSSFLHAQSISQFEKNKKPNFEEMKSKFPEILLEIRKVIDSNIWSANFGSFHNFECNCGRKIKRRIGSFSEEQGIVCPSCASVYDLNKENKNEVKLREFSFKCNSCEKEIFFNRNLMKEATRLTCKCGQAFRVVMGVVPELNK